MRSLTIPMFLCTIIGAFDYTLWIGTLTTVAKVIYPKSEIKSQKKNESHKWKYHIFYIIFRTPIHLIIFSQFMNLYTLYQPMEYW